MNANYDTCLLLVLANEGGFVDDPHDPGGATNYGVTLDSWSAYIGRTATVDDIKALTPKDVTEFYRTRYWDKLGCDQLPVGLDYCVFDFGVNSGVYRAAITLQIISGTHLDGIIGPQSIAAANTLDEDDAIDKYQDARIQFLNGLEGSRYFGKGWDARVDRVKGQALAMIGSAGQI